MPVNGTVPISALEAGDYLVELTEVVAWENASARFNRALRIGSQHLWAGSPPDPDADH